MNDLKALVSALQKFTEWQDEYAQVLGELQLKPAADHLMEVLAIPKEDVRCLIGGSNAPVFLTAAKEITRLRELVSSAVKGLKHLGEFHYPEDEPRDPHTLDCSLAGRVSRVFCTGMTRSCDLCREFGENPEYREGRENER